MEALRTVLQAMIDQGVTVVEARAKLGLTKRGLQSELRRLGMRLAPTEIYSLPQRTRAQR